MNRRTFLAGTGAALLAAPLAGEAQLEARIAFLCVDACSALPNPVRAWDRAFLTGLQHSGYVLGPSI